MSLRPYISYLPDQLARSREHGGRPFPGKRRLRRTFKKSARQLRRLAIVEELAMIEEERAEAKKAEKIDRDLEEELDALSFDAERYFDEEWDSYDYDIDHELERDLERYEYSLYQKSLEDDYHWQEDEAYSDRDDSVRRDRQHEEFISGDYDWDSDPDFTEKQLIEHAPAFDIAKWRARKK